MDVDTPSVQAHEAELFARLLHWGIVAGFLLLVLSFAVYMLGLAPSFIPPEQLPNFWSQPVTLYLQQTQAPTGWGWLRLALHGDFSNLVGIAVLCGCSIPPLLALVPLFLRQGDRVYAVICVLETLVLLMAASGILSRAH